MVARIAAAQAFVGTDLGAQFGVSLRPFGAHRGPGGPQLRLQFRLGRHRIAARQRDFMPRQRRTDHARECRGRGLLFFAGRTAQRGQRVLRMQGLRQHCGIGRVPGHDLAAPEIGHHLFEHRARIGHEFERERQSARKRAVGQRALAEAVDGVDRGLIETVQGGHQQAARVGALVVVGEALRFIQSIAKGFVALAGVDPAQHVRQPRAQAFAQFGGRGLGESDDQNLLGQQPAFEHQAQIQPGDGPGLARTGTGFDELCAVKRRGQGERHASPPSSSTPSAWR